MRAGSRPASSAGALPALTRVSRLLDDILNRVPDRQAPYVGASAFTHKAGLHASAILKDPATYEHVPPETVGNARVIPMSNQAGQSNLRERLAQGRDRRSRRATRGSPRILAEVKAREDRGFAYDGASASFEILAREHARADAAVLRGRALPGDGRAPAGRPAARW